MRQKDILPCDTSVSIQQGIYYKGHLEYIPRMFLEGKVQLLLPGLLVTARVHQLPDGVPSTNEGTRSCCLSSILHTLILFSFFLDESGGTDSSCFFWRGLPFKYPFCMWVFCSTSQHHGRFTSRQHGPHPCLCQFLEGPDMGLGWLRMGWILLLQPVWVTPSSFSVY